MQIVINGAHRLAELDEATVIEVGEAVQNEEVALDRYNDGVVGDASVAQYREAASFFGKLLEDRASRPGEDCTPLRNSLISFKLP